MKHGPSAFFNKGILTFSISAIVAFIINYIGSLLLHDELRLNWPIIIIVGIIAGLAAYLSSLRRHTAALEERIEELERKLKSK